MEHPPPISPGTVDAVRPSRIAIIGNGGGGKTTLARHLARHTGLPLTHVDAIQFLSGFARRPADETSRILDELATGPRWIIDGFGPLPCIERRLHRAELILFVDFPLWRHYLWATRRQLAARTEPRAELPEGCDEGSLRHTWLLYRILWRVHREIRPRLIAMCAEPGVRERVRWLRTPAEIRRAYRLER